MMSPVFLLLGAALLSSDPTAGQTASQIKIHPQRDLVGSWHVIYSEHYCGDRLELDRWRDERWFFSQRMVSGPGPETFKWSAAYVIVPAEQGLQRMDLQFSVSGIDVIIPALARVEENRLILCLEHRENARRPKEFASKPGTAIRLLVLQKE